VRVFPTTSMIIFLL
jgi:hypothetical protein